MATLAETMDPLFAAQYGGPASETDADRSRRADWYSARAFAAIAAGSEDEEVIRLAAVAAAAVASGEARPELFDLWRVETAAEVDGDVETAILAFMEDCGLEPFSA